MGLFCIVTGTGNIVLVGFMGTGKTAVAREIARILGIPHIDTDQLTVEQEGMSISQIFAEKGEKYFRELEHSILKDIKEKVDDIFVLSLGGGMPTYEPNLELIKELGYVVWLKTSAEETYNRIGANSDRPLLQGGDPMEKISTLLAERTPSYEALSEFDIETEGLNVFELASGIIDSASYHFSGAEVAEAGI